MSRTVLKIDASARINGSLSRQITDYLHKSLGTDVIERDLAKTSLPLLTESHIGAYFTAKDKRSAEQQQLLSISDQLIAELKAVNTLVIGAPIYNFSIPAALKAWIDLVCRAGETFVYTESGPKGLLNIDTAYIVVTAGGTPVAGDIDFNSPYLQQICGFMGVKQSHIIDVSGSKRDPDTLIDFAKAQVDKLVN
ncbi:MAG: NAD(P)H-dependent oxidoreductase [Pseudomonadota bacterium]